MTPHATARERIARAALAASEASLEDQAHDAVVAAEEAWFATPATIEECAAAAAAELEAGNDSGHARWMRRLEEARGAAS